MDRYDRENWLLVPLPEHGSVVEAPRSHLPETTATANVIQKIAMAPAKTIALIAHDNKKRDLLEWALYNRDTLARHRIFATGTTGQVLGRELAIPITSLQSGPLGGDQQIGGKISEGEIDFLIFFWDPLQPMPHDPDVRALLRLAVVWNIPIACNRASADFIISSPLMLGDYDRLIPDYDGYLSRSLVQ